MNSTRQIQEVERSAHAGSHGAWRKTFCTEYRRALNQIRLEIYQELLLHLAAIGESVTCKKGCIHCCFHYVSVSIAHSIVIVDYLYSRADALKQFLRNYDRWRNSIESNPRKIEVLRKLEECTTLSPIVKRTPQDLLSDYHDMTIPCPFLFNSACAIYPVRPICCESHYSVSPPQWCMATSPNMPAIYEILPSEANLHKLQDLADHRLTLHQESLPTIVYRLLTKGLPLVLQELDELAGA